VENYGFDYVNKYVIDTSNFWHTNKTCETTYGGGKCEDVWGGFCGGTYSMLWRGEGSSLEKLKKMWWTRPIQDADCVIANTSWLRSYCVQIGIWDHLLIKSEESDISKLVGK
jgi:hypothetical protein